MGKIIRVRQTESERSQSRMKRLEIEHRQYNKEMRQIGCHSRQMSFDDYLRYKNGYTPRNLKEREIKRSEDPMPLKKEPEIKSLNSSMVCSSASVSKSREYTGSLIKGLGTMHKSSIVPIMNKEQANDLAHMRR